MFGNLEVIIGGMFGGKTTYLILQTKEHHVKQNQIQLFSPSIDNRFSEEQIVTHDGLSAPCQQVPKSEDIITQIDKKTRIIGIDEVQMFDDNILNIINYLQKEGKTIIVSGLLLDFRGEYFPFRSQENIEMDSKKNMSDLLIMTNKIIQKPSFCLNPSNGSVCGVRTYHTQRYLADGITVAPYDDQTIMIGKENISVEEKNKIKRIYKPKCREHFTPYK